MGFFDDDNGDAFAKHMDAVIGADPTFIQRDHRKRTERRGGLRAVCNRSSLAVFGMPLRDLEKEATKTLPPHRELKAAHEVLRIVAGYDPDHAELANRVGFAKSDVAIGHALASAPAASVTGHAGIALLAWRLAMRYRRNDCTDAVPTLALASEFRFGDVVDVLVIRQPMLEAR